jgi:hypothetical protein
MRKKSTGAFEDSSKFKTFMNFMPELIPIFQKWLYKVSPPPPSPPLTSPPPAKYLNSNS